MTCPGKTVTDTRPVTRMVMVRAALTGRSNVLPDGVSSTTRPVPGSVTSWKFAAVTRPAVSVTVNARFSSGEPSSPAWNRSRKVRSKASAVNWFAPPGFESTIVYTNGSPASPVSPAPSTDTDLLTSTCGSMTRTFAVAAVLGASSPVKVNAAALFTWLLAFVCAVFTTTARYVNVIVSVTTLSRLALVMSPRVNVSVRPVFVTTGVVLPVMLTPVDSTAESSATNASCGSSRSVRTAPGIIASGTVSVTR